jgi:calcineurin-like phosphoesterase family protein
MDIYRETTWQGGTVFVEDEHPNILFAKDGEVYDFDGYKAIVIGGAYSPDKHYRLANGWSWFADEQPSEEVKAHVEAKLERIGWEIDIVLSHTCPQKYLPTEVFIPGLDQSTVDGSTELWLNSIEGRLDYRHWYCGHFHTSKRIDKLQFMFKDFDALRPSNNEQLQLRPSIIRSTPQIFYTADLHLGHANIVGLCNRPFADIDEMNKTLIDNWNARVRDIDHVYIVGDLAYRSPESAAKYLEQMRGIKHLIIGNHDKSWIKQVQLSSYFESVETMQEIKDSGRKVVLSHYPMMTWPGHESYMVYGHIHANKNAAYWPLLKTMTHALNACVEVNGYQPATLNELMENNVFHRESE